MSRPAGPWSDEKSESFCSSHGLRLAGMISGAYTSVCFGDLIIIGYETEKETL